MSTARTITRADDLAIPTPFNRRSQRPRLSAILVLAADIVVLWFILWSFFGNTAIGVRAAPGGWLPIWPLLPLFVVIYRIFDLYPGVSVSPVDEIRSISLANATVFLFLSVMLALRHAAMIPQVLCLSAFVSASIAILTMRSMVRRIGSQFDWWGYPVLLIGGGAVARAVLHKLNSQPHLGLRPVAVVTDQGVDWETDGVSVYQFEHLGGLASNGIQHAIVAAPELSQSEFVEALERGGDAFPHLMLIPDTEFIWKAGSYTRDFIGVLSLHVRNNLLSRGSQIVKRAVDLACSTVLTFLLLPIIALISLFIVLETGFPVFYCQKRLGRGGRAFRIWKFRTMARNSAEILEHYLASRPVLRKEWAENHKLRNDPRITRVGRLLRKTSLDELPQLWNVIIGDMSLVGPRPIVYDEISKYREAYSIYMKTHPGITGLWQISGRNHTTYEERVSYDTYYVRNWSFWMDLYLLAKTVSVVLTGDGAY
jgi:Undecaprenyl-phosphate galactose phosphotransferase WbaP